MPSAVPRRTPVPEACTPLAVPHHAPVPGKLSFTLQERRAHPRPCQRTCPCSLALILLEACMPRLVPSRTPVHTINWTSRSEHSPDRAEPHACAPAETTDDDTPAAVDIEEDQPPIAPGSSFGAGTSGAGPSFQGTSTVSNDEVLAQLLSRMDVFDTRLTGIESMITNHFQSLEITQGSIDSRLDTMQGQLQTILHLLQPPPPPPPEA
ncbi:hypothetical protein JCGZ_13807 [Jatropha curcas]|uniref:Uncharacterized protein n=1 Tax=Jatropha curcas TaxID=180498 RepID=A0A067KG94_JATCU|nr:hypothetical protein JCGZ_13807 [Jatropha curcas]